MQVKGVTAAKETPEGAVVENQCLGNIDVEIIIDVLLLYIILLKIDC